MSDAALATCFLPPDGAFIDGVAARLLSEPMPRADFSSCLVLVSSLPLATELRTALAAAAGRPLLLPRFDTLRRWALAASLPDLPVALPESERLVLLHSALAARDWFDERALWGIASELASLSDELSAASVRLPENEAALIAQLERAYALRASLPLAFEARVVHEMWRALAASDRPDAPSAYRMRLARLAQVVPNSAMPTFLLLDGPPQECLTAAELDFVSRLAAVSPVRLFAPMPRSLGVAPIATTLAAAWPDFPPADNCSLAVRAARLRQQLPESPLAGRLQMVPVYGREAEAEAVVAQVFAWFDEGLRRIALIAEDRLTARRVRALLERRNVLVADETGWKMSTTRAAATVDALLETAASDGYHQDVLDLFKSPHCFPDLDPAIRSGALLTLEKAIRRASAKSGLAAFRHALAAYGGEGVAPAAALLDRLDVALRILGVGGKPAPLPKWIDRLLRGLDALGATTALASDAAGAELLERLNQRQTELAGSAASFSFSAWRDWLNRELESAAFRDKEIVSPVVMLPRHDVRLRRFEAAIVIGADAEQMKPAGGGVFFSQAVRHDLGLPTRADAERALRRDLELLLSVVPRVVVTWQCEQAGEAKLLAPEFDLLATLHQLAWGDDLYRRPLLAVPEATPAATLSPSLPRLAMPSVLPSQLPARLSVSALASLVACPYQFFSRHVLRLNEFDEVSEELEKGDYGQLVHRSLERFHAQYPVLSTLGDAEALAALSAVVDQTFAQAEADNWLAIGWRLRWQNRLAAYLDWQRAREAAGWRWQAAEVPVAKTLALADGGAVEFHGRIDRIDSGPAGIGLIDYKTSRGVDLRKRMADDLQLPVYALLFGEVAEAAYVALDDDKPCSLACVDDLAGAALAQEARFKNAFVALRAGASMPAHGSDAVCRYCEARGLCRRDHVDG